MSAVAKVSPIDEPHAAQPAAEADAKVTKAKSMASGTAIVERLSTDTAETSMAFPDMLKRARTKSGKSLQQIVGEIARLSFGASKLSVDEYFGMSLFDTEELDGQDPRTFIGERRARQLIAKINCRQDWWGFGEDKLAVEAFLRGSNLPTTETIGVVGEPRPLPGLTVIKDAEGFKAFLADDKNFPMFCKPVDSLRSLGSASFDRFDAETGELVMPTGERVNRDAFVDEVMAAYNGSYLIQRRISVHPDVAALCGQRVGTVRVVTLWGDNGPEFWRAAWKIPAGRNVADNFWRGNLLADINPKSGRVTRAMMTNGGWAEQVAAHPDTARPLTGFQLPHWDDIKALAVNAASGLPQVPLIGWDIAIGEHGGVIVEPNFVPDFKLVQIASRKGALEPCILDAVARGEATYKARIQALKSFDRNESRQRVAKVTGRDEKSAVSG